AAQDFGRFVDSAMLEDRLGAMWVLALCTAMRPGELLGLQWGDFSESMRRVTVQRGLVRPQKRGGGEGEWRLEVPKTEESVREMPLDEELVFLLRRHRTQQAEEKLAAGPAYEDHGFVFANELGQPLDNCNLRNRNLKRILKRAGLSEALHL